MKSAKLFYFWLFIGCTVLQIQSLPITLPSKSPDNQIADNNHKNSSLQENLNNEKIPVIPSKNDPDDLAASPIDRITQGNNTKQDNTTQYTFGQWLNPFRNNKKSDMKINTDFSIPKPGDRNEQGQTESQFGIHKSGGWNSQFQIGGNSGHGFGLHHEGGFSGHFGIGGNSNSRIGGSSGDSSNNNQESGSGFGIYKSGEFKHEFGIGGSHKSGGSGSRNDESGGSSSGSSNFENLSGIHQSGDSQNKLGVEGNSNRESGGSNSQKSKSGQNLNENERSESWHGIHKSGEYQHKLELGGKDDRRASDTRNDHSDSSSSKNEASNIEFGIHKSGKFQHEFKIGGNRENVGAGFSNNDCDKLSNGNSIRNDTSSSQFKIDNSNKFGRYFGLGHSDNNGVDNSDSKNFKNCEDAKGSNSIFWKGNPLDREKSSSNEFFGHNKIDAGSDYVWSQGSNQQKDLKNIGNSNQNRNVNNEVNDSQSSRFQQNDKNKDLRGNIGGSYSSGLSIHVSGQERNSNNRGNSNQNQSVNNEVNDSQSSRWSAHISGQGKNSVNRQSEQNQNLRDLRGNIGGSYSSGLSVHVSGQERNTNNRQSNQSRNDRVNGSQNSGTSVHVSGQEKYSVDHQTNQNQNQRGEINGSQSNGLSVDVSGKKQTSSQGSSYGARSINISHEEKYSSSSQSQSQNSSSDLEAQKTFKMELQKLIKKTKENHPGYIVNISVDKKGSGKAGERPENVLKQTFDLTGEDALNKELSFKLSGGKKILMGGTNETSETIHVREHASSISKGYQSSGSTSQSSSSRFNSQAQGSMSQAASESQTVSRMKKVV
ncbi:hypothetical protein PV327_003620 [Microctonus hyperodae]|uniref:Uncharacterized protein n=1 Tax=Microctonus hyperodae TaxID=165561 RepID=A0AA39G4E3_MICHY|nr:hypothetical protein PV327_003620 [Microctonus hyperodae]